MEICVYYKGVQAWIPLPATHEEVAEILGVPVDFDENPQFMDEIVIKDVETDLSLPYIKEISFDWFNELAECEEHFHDAAVAISEANSLTSVDWITCKNAMLAKEVTSADQLGEYIVDMGYLDPIPDHLRRYLNYTEIGEDWEEAGSYTSVGFLFDW